MANQMIALQARAPQTNFMGDMARQNAAMINQMMQQRAAERQAAQAQQTMDISAAQEARAAALAGAQQSEAAAKAQKEQLAVIAAAMTNAREQLQYLAPGDLQGATAFRNATIAAIPALKDWMPSAEAIANDEGTRLRLGAQAKDWLDKNVPTAQAEVQVDPNTNELMEVRTGGFQPGMGASGAYPIQKYALTPDQPPAQSAIPTPPQLNANPAPADDGRAAALQGAHAFLEANPIAFNPAQGAAPAPLTQETAPQIIQAAIQTGAIDEAHVQQLRQMVGPQYEPQLAQWMQQNNVRITPSGQPSMQSAVYRPEAGGATMQQAGYAPTGTVAQGKPPMQAPMPGSAIVPIERVREEARAGRESPQEAAARAGATATATAAAQRQAELAKTAPARQRVSTILAGMRQAYDALDKSKDIPSEARSAGANIWDYLATTSGGREVQRMLGTEASKYLTRIGSLRKQLATAIKNATGMSAQEMNSNVELNLMLDSLSDPTQGIEAARQTIADIESLYGVAQRQRPAPTSRGRRPLSSFGGR